MKKFIPAFAAFLLVLSAHSCFYSDSEVHYVEPVAGIRPQMTVSSNLDTLSAPTVNDSLEINYQVSVDGGDFYYIYASVNELLVYESDTTVGSFRLYSSDAGTEGSDTLFFELYYSSNSNSLADVYGYEALDTLISFAIDFNPEALK